MSLLSVIFQLAEALFVHILPQGQMHRDTGGVDCQCARVHRELILYHFLLVPGWHMGAQDGDTRGCPSLEGL